MSKESYKNLTEEEFCEFLNELKLSSHKAQPSLPYRVCKNNGVVEIFTFCSDESCTSCVEWEESLKEEIKKQI